MSQENLFDVIKNMDKKERRALLDKVTAALSPEQQKQVKAVVQDKKQMDKIRSNATSADLETLIQGLNGGDAKDFLNSPQVADRLKEILG
jgi:hypothetical protein